jgi:hypothetical protein
VALRDHYYSRCSAPLQIDPGLWQSILPRVLTGFAEGRFMRYNSDHVASHSAITGIVESYKVE